MILFARNQLIQFLGKEERTERILWVDSNNIHCYTIDIYAKNAFPIFKKVKDLEALYEDKKIHLVFDEPFLIYFLDEELPEKHKEIRDKRWNFIEGLVNSEPDIYKKSNRWNLIVQVMNEKKTTEKTIYRYLRLYWQRGMSPNSLLPDYRKSGNPGKERNLSDAKVGRPRKYLESGAGINITKEIISIFNISIQKYFFGMKHSTLMLAYNMMLKEFFTDFVYFENGKKKYSIKDIGDIPSYDQFYYWYGRLYTDKEQKIRKKGKRKYLLEDRETLSKSDVDKLGPGWKYQVDATIGDVYLISEKNTDDIIGRPVIYSVMDVFSRMIVGIYVGWEGPSWNGGRMALINTVSDKVEFCKKYGITISPDEWPSHHLPDTLLADRGEMEGSQIEPYIQAFNVRVENTPPYRADWKGIIEQNFRVMHDRVKPLSPGAIDKDHRVRGTEDYRLQAKLNLKDFTEIIIYSILYHNNFHYLQNYNPDEMMLTEDVPLRPIDLWEWGIKNRSGQLRTYPEDRVAIQLLPRAEQKVKVSGSGIRFHRRAYYTCDKAIKENWYSTANIKGEWEVVAAYDPRTMKNIYIINGDGSYEICRLTEPYKHYESFTYEEFLRAQRNYQKLKREHKQEVVNEQATFYASIEKKVEEAEKRAKKSKDNSISKKTKVNNIRENRAEEKAEKRKEEVYEFENTGKNTTGIFLTDEELEEEKAEQTSSNTMDLLRSIKTKRKKGANE